MAEETVAAPRKASLLIVFLVVFIDLLGFGIVLPLLPRYGEYFHAGAKTLGLLMASFSAMQFLFAPVWGRISDRVGRRPVLLLGLAGSVLFYGLFGYASSFAPDDKWLGWGPLNWMFLARIGAGIAGATIPTAQAYIADSTGARERGKGMALIGAAFGLGFTFGPLLAVPFAPSDPQAAPSPGPGYIASGLSAAALVAAIVLLPESLRPGSKPSGRRWLDLGALIAALRRPAIGPVLITIFLTTFAFAQFETTLSLLTESLGLSQRMNYYVFAYLGFTLALSQGLLVRRLLPIIREWRAAMSGAFVMMLGLLLVSWPATLRLAEKIGSRNDTALMLLAWILPICVIGFSLLTPSLHSLLSLATAEEDQGEVLGVGQSMSALARIAGPVAGIPLFFHDPRLPYWSAAGVMIVGTLLVLSLKRSHHIPAGAAETTPVSH